MHLLQKGGVGETEAFAGQVDQPINVDEVGSSSKKLKDGGKVIPVKRSQTMDTFLDRSMTSAEVDKANIVLLRYVGSLLIKEDDHLSLCI
jgi:hypothetical protein